MQTIAALTVTDWTKISPDLRWSLERAAKFSAENIHRLEWGGFIIPWLPGLLGPGGIRADVLITHADGQQYCLVDTEIPSGWTAAMWVDFVVGIIKSPYVMQADTLREFPVTRFAIIPEGAIRVGSPRELAAVAGRAPAVSVTPQPHIQPPPFRRPPAPQLPAHPYAQPYAPAEDVGIVERISGTLGVSPTVLIVGAVALVGLVGVAVIAGRRKPSPAPVRQPRRR